MKGVDGRLLYHGDRFETVEVRLPIPVCVLWERAQQKVGRALQLNVKKFGWRITVIEALSALVSNSSEAQLRAALVGAAEPPAVEAAS